MVLSVESLPVLSQIQSLLLWVRGDKFGARQTQIAFSKQCYIVSQLRSIFYDWLYCKDSKQAIDTQIEFYC